MNRSVTRRARNLRQNSTDAEKRLWQHLRLKQLAGWKFRRQQPLGTFIVDFICLEKRLIIEIDGGQHAGNPKDTARDQWLKTQGFTILRFWNNEVLTNIDGVLEVIKEKLASFSLSPCRSPKGNK